jgi:hypothetical protein
VMSQHNTEEDLPRKQQQPQECKTCPVLYGRVRPARAVEQHKTPRFPRRFRNRRVDSFHPFHCHLGPTLAPTHPSVKVTRGESSRGGVPLSTSGWESARRQGFRIAGGSGPGAHVGLVGWSLPERGTLTLGAGDIRCWEGAARLEAEAALAWTSRR